MQVQISPSCRGREIRFQVEGELAGIFKSGGFSLFHSFDISPSDRVLSSMAIGLLTPILAHYLQSGEEHQIHIATGVWTDDIPHWERYLRLASTIRFSGPIGKAPASSAVAPTDRRSAIAYLYGGGKDSAAMLALMQKAYPESTAHILRLHWSKSSAAHRSIFEQEVLRPLRKVAEFEYFSVESTLHAELADYKDAARLHLGRYLAGFMAYLERENPRFICHGYDALEFHGEAYRRAHPSVVRHVDAVYANQGWPTRVRGPCFGFPPYANFRLINACRPDLLEHVYMCESLKSRWCYDCRKCFTFGILCLATQSRPRGFDMGRMFSEENSYIRSMQEFRAFADGPGVMPGKLAQKLAYKTHLPAVYEWIEAALAAEDDDVSQFAREVLAGAAKSASLNFVPELNSVWEAAVRAEGGDHYRNVAMELCDEAAIPVLTTNERVHLGSRVEGRKVSYRFGLDDLT